MAGFTTVHDVGSRDGVDVALKKAIQRGDIVGPRMFVAATGLSITGGYHRLFSHPTYKANRFDALRGKVLALIAEANAPEDAKEALARRVERFAW